MCDKTDNICDKTYSMGDKTDNLTINGLQKYYANDELFEIGIDEAAILKKMFLIYFYDRTIRTNIANASSDTIVQVTDQGSSVRKINKNEVIKSLSGLKKQEYTEMKELIRDYKSNQVRPRQVVGDDTVKGIHQGDAQFVRTEVYNYKVS